MSGTAVYILTTEGPVAIQRISEEDPSINSVICLDGLAQILPVSAAYDAFVRRPVGVIERMTGHGAYRMDVESRIDEGRSWQLAAYIAHAARLQAGGGDVTVYATGEVDRELGVRPVERVEQKLEALTRHLAEEGAPSGNAVVLVPDGTDPLPDQIGGIRLVRVSRAADALSVSGVAAPPLPAGAAPGKSPSPGKRRTPPLMVLLGAALIAAALFWIGGDFARWSGLTERGRILELEQDMAQSDETAFGGWRAAMFRKWLSLKRPENGPTSLQGALFTAPDAAACADVASRERVPMTPVYEGSSEVCMAEMRAIGGPAKDVMIGRLAYWPAGLGSTERPARVMRGSKDASGRTWTLEFDQRPAPGAALRLVVITGPVDINGSQPWYQDLLSAPVAGAAFDAARARLERLGFRVTALDWRRE